MSKTVLIAVAGGAASALALIAGVNSGLGGVFLVNLAPLPLLLVGLGLGTGAAAIAGVSGIVLAATLGGGLVAAGVYGGMHAVPSWLVVHQSLSKRGTPGGGEEWFAAGSALSLLAVAGTIISGCIAAAAAPGIEDTVRDLIGREFTARIPSGNAALMGEWAGRVAPFLVGMAGAAWVAMMALNSIVAQGLLAHGGRNLRPSPRWSGLTLPHWLSWLLVVTAAVALIAEGDLGYLARNAIFVLAVPYFFLGLAAAHGLCRRLPAPGVALGVFYVSVVWFLDFAAPLIAGVGVVEQWIGVRRRFGAPDRETE